MALLIAAPLITGCGARRNHSAKATRWTTDGVRYTQFIDREFRVRSLVVEHGAADRPPVLLVHGVGDKAADDWRQVEKALSATYRVLTVHLPGFGRSGHRNKRYTPTRYARFLREVVTRVAKQPVFVVGHSMGGAICLRFAALAPSSVRKLVLVDAAGILHRRAFVNHVVSDQMAKLGRYGDLLLSHAQATADRLMDLSTWLHLDPNLALRSLATRKAMLGGDPSRIAGLALMMDDLGPTLDHVPAETLLIWGSADPIAPLRTGYLLRSRLANARLVRIEGAHHVPMTERPVVFNRLLLRFLAGNTVGEGLLKPSMIAPGEVLAVARCTDRDDQIITGRSSKIVVKNCQNLLIHDAQTRSITVDDSLVRLRDVQVRAVGDVPALTIHRSRVLVTGGALAGEPPLFASESHMDLAGVRLIGDRVATCGARASSVVASVATVERGDGKGRRHLHGEWRLAAQKSLQQPFTDATLVNPIFKAELVSGAELISKVNQRAAWSWPLTVVTAKHGALPAGVRVWRLDLTDAEARTGRTRACLSTAERAAFRGAQGTTQRARRIMTRAALRSLLGAWRGLAPAAVPLCADRDGKPGWDGPEAVAFNVSHSATCALIALSERGAIGVDIEQLRPRRGLRDIALDRFTTEEAARLQEATDADRLTLFYRIWCGKEACFKADGRGLAMGLRSFTVRVPHSGSAELRAPQTGLRANPAACHPILPTPSRPKPPWLRWRLSALDVGDAYCAKLASPALASPALVSPGSAHASALPVSSR